MLYEKHGNLITVKRQCWNDCIAALHAVNAGQLSRARAQVLLDAYFDLIEAARLQTHPTTPSRGI